MVKSSDIVTSNSHFVRLPKPASSGLGWPTGFCEHLVELATLVPDTRRTASTASASWLLRLRMPRSERPPVAVAVTRTTLRVCRSRRCTPHAPCSMPQRSAARCSSQSRPAAPAHSSSCIRRDNAVKNAANRGRNSQGISLGISCVSQGNTRTNGNFVCFPGNQLVRSWVRTCMVLKASGSADGSSSSTSSLDQPCIPGGQ